MPRELLESAVCLLCGGSEGRTVCTTPQHMMQDTGQRFHFVQCADCDLVFLNPRVKAEHLPAYYPPNYLPYRGASAWGKHADAVERSQRRLDRRRAALAKPFLHSSTARTLDVGCGRPTFLQELAAQGHRGTGIDFQAEGWTEGAEAGIELIEADPKDFESEQPFDLITMWHYLEHDYAPRETLNHLLSLAHSGTHLIVEVPDFGSVSRRVFKGNWEGYHAPRHTAIYTESTLRSLLERSGWEVVKARRYGTLDPHALWWMSQMERRKIDWEGSMEPHFTGYVLGLMGTWPLFALKRWVRTGVQLAIARPRMS